MKGVRDGIIGGGRKTQWCVRQNIWGSKKNIMVSAVEWLRVGENRDGACGRMTGTGRKNTMVRAAHKLRVREEHNGVCGRMTGDGRNTYWFVQCKT